ncbi:MAG TPA: hypothetical protein VFU88_18570 [Ktedonobacterales bacterium]|nr:hypothetical protein [Ktedonobacterales bacterium]
MSTPSAGSGAGRPAAPAAAAPAPGGAVSAPPAGSASASAPKQVVCPVCGTSFEPRSTAGKCPVCGEQVVPAAATATPIITPLARWLADGGWRLLLVLLLVVYQIVLFIWVIQQLIQKHAL